MILIKNRKDVIQQSSFSHTTRTNNNKFEVSQVQEVIWRVGLELKWVSATGTMSKKLNRPVGNCRTYFIPTEIFKNFQSCQFS